MGQLRGKHGLDNAASIISSVEFCLANQGPGSIAISAREQTLGSRGCTQGVSKNVTSGHPAVASGR